MKKKVVTKYIPKDIESKWQEAWDTAKIYSPDMNTASKPFYNLMMFPYPSAEGMHVGNMYAFTGSDIYGRFKRMAGFDVFEPMGLDGFGIHSENYALKIGKHPKEQAKVSQANFYRQLKATGNAFDWSRTLETYDPKYYKWTQWIFIELFKAGLAYKKNAEVNFCPSCKTVLADEQVIDGKCERCGTEVVKKALEQWFFRITKYADRLLKNIETLDWSEKVKIAQRQWIGKKEGITITYKVKNVGHSIDVFTTRPDTNFGATFIAIAPEHPFVKTAIAVTTKIPHKKGEIHPIQAYVDMAKKKNYN
jgi:leucyl-tRNA synthetase